MLLVRRHRSCDIPGSGWDQEVGAPCMPRAWAEEGSFVSPSMVFLTPIVFVDHPIDSEKMAALHRDVEFYLKPS